MAHAVKGFGGGGAAADVPVFVFRVGADDEEVVGGGDSAVAGSSGEYKDIARLHSEMLATLSAKDQVSMASGESENFMCG